MDCEAFSHKKMQLTWCCVLLNNMMTRRRLRLDLIDPDAEDHLEVEASHPFIDQGDDDIIAPAASQAMLDAGKARLNQLVFEFVHNP
jgi:hypothetical protein